MTLRNLQEGITWREKNFATKKAAIIHMVKNNHISEGGIIYLRQETVKSYGFYLSHLSNDYAPDEKYIYRVVRSELGYSCNYGLYGVGSVYV